MLMIFFFIMPGVMSGLGNLLVPIQLCVPEMMFPKVNNLGTTPIALMQWWTPDASGMEWYA
jgi:heme/copper-type cytochrome/quinol oxidase subunit 1